MSTSNIMLPDLTTWAERCMSTLYKDTKEHDFNADFDATFAKDAQITFNGRSMTCEQYKKELRQEKFLERDAQVAFSGAVEVPWADHRDGLVCLHYDYGVWSR